MDALAYIKLELWLANITLICILISIWRVNK